MPKDSTVRNGFKQSLAGAILMALCVAAGLLIANLADLVHPGLFLQGRNFHRVAFLVALLIGGAGMWWYRVHAGHVVTMLASLGLVEIVIAVLIGVFSGSFVVDRFFVDWFLGVNVYVAVPWLTALALGSLWPIKGNRV
jgi:hypothetical protein